MPPEEWWPAGAAGLTSRRLALSTNVGVRVIEGGPANGDPVVLVHGWGIHAYLWRRTIPALIAAGHRVIALDLPGHGLSDRPLDAGSYALRRMTGHLLALFDAMEISAASLVGQSMGGRIAFEFAREHPHRVRSLTVFGGVGFGTVPRMVSLASYLPAPRGALSGLLTQRWMAALGKAMAYGRRATPDQTDIDAYWAATQFPDCVAALRQGLIEFTWDALTADAIASVRAPTLVVFGTRDRTVRPLHAEALVRSLPHGRLYWVRDAGHVANEEAPDEVNPLLVEFISAAG